MSQKLRIAVLISGGGSNLQSLIDACQDKDYPAEIVCVISSKQEAYGLERARKVGITELYVPSKERTRTEFEDDLQVALTQNQVDLLCLAGFMRILSPSFIESWNNRILNIHPSLLPKFGGPGMYGHHVHEAVLKAGELESGASVHLVTAGVDEGPILLKSSVPVRQGDDAKSLAERVLEVEHKIYPRALEEYALRILSNTDVNS